MVAKYPMTWGYCTTSYSGNPALSPGAAVTGGFSNADGTIVAVLGTALTHDVEMLEVIISAAGATGAAGVDTSAIVDILIDRAGGTTWDTTNILIEGLQCGYMAAQGGSGSISRRRWLFPVWIPAGTTIAARSASAAASGATVVEVSVRCFGGPSRPDQWWCGQKIDAVGLDRAASKGTLIPPNASANTYGNWTSVGSATARRYGCLIPSVQGNGISIQMASRQLQVGISSLIIPGSTTFNFYGISSTDCVSDFIEDKLIFVDVPEGTQLQARSRSSSASASSDSLIIHGVA